MKIELIRYNVDGTHSYHHKPLSYCCEKLKKNPAIHFAEDFTEYGEYTDRNEDDEDGYLPALCIWQNETTYDWEDTWENEYNYPIHYCPFCGEKIEIELVDEKDFTEKYNVVVQEVDEINKKLRNISRKKEEDLRQQRREKDDFLNSLFQFGPCIEE